MSTHRLLAILDDLIEFGPFSISTSKKVFRGLAEGVEKIPTVRPIGMLEKSSYVPSWMPADRAKLATEQAYGYGSNIGPGSVVIPREKHMDKNMLVEQAEIREWHKIGPRNSIATAMHERGHHADPDSEVSAAKLKNLMWGKERDQHKINDEVIANRLVLDQFQKHGTPQEIAAWKKIANRQLHTSYRSGSFQRRDTGKPKSLSDAKQFYRDNPYIQKKTTALSAILDDMIFIAEQQTKQTYG